MSGSRRLPRKLEGEAREAAIEARRLARTEAEKAATARPSTSVERVAIVAQRLSEEGYSARTIHVYAAELRRGEWWCEQRGKTLLNVPGELVAEYVAARPYSFATRKLIRSAFGHYWRIFGRPNPPLWLIRVPKRPRMICRAPNDDAARALAAHARARGGIEAFAVLLAMYAGLRREEIASLRWDCFRVDGWLQVIGKGEVCATVPVHPVILDAMGKLDRSSPWVFPGRFGGHVAPATVWAWVGRLAREAGLEHTAPHVLRHLALATANDRTGDLRAVQDLARHAEISTTAGYTRATAARLVAAVEAINYDEAPPDTDDGQPGPDAEMTELRAEVARLRGIITHLTAGETGSRPALELLAGGEA